MCHFVYFYIQLIKRYITKYDLVKLKSNSTAKIRSILDPNVSITFFYCIAVCNEMKIKNLTPALYPSFYLFLFTPNRVSRTSRHNAFSKKGLGHQCAEFFVVD